MVPFRERREAALPRWAPALDSAIPMPAPPAEAELEAVEAMLYDKETRGIDPGPVRLWLRLRRGLPLRRGQGVLALADLDHGGDARREMHRLLGAHQGRRSCGR